MVFSNINREKVLNSIDKAAFFFFAVLIFWLPFSNAAIESAFGFIYFLFILKGLVKRPTFRQIKDFFKKRINMAFLVFFICIGLSMFASGPHLELSFKAWMFKWGEGLLIFYMAQVFLNRKRLKVLLYVLALVTFVTCLDGFYQKVTNHDFFRGYVKPGLGGSMSTLHGVTASYRHFNHFSTFLVVMFFIIMSLLRESRKFSKKLLFAVLLFCVLINLFFTYSRGGWVAFILVNMLILMLFPEKKTRAISLSLLFIFTLGIFTIPNIRERFILIFQAGGDADRFRVWRAAFAMFRDSNFLIGKGVGTFMAHFRTYAKAHTQYAHNCYLQILAESGILGLLSFLWLLGELFLAGYKKLKRKFDYLFLGVFSAFIALSIHIFFDTQLYSTKLAILFWVIVSFVAVYLQESDNSQSLS